MDVVAGVCTLLGAVTEVPANPTRPVTVVEEDGGPRATSAEPQHLTRQDITVSVWADTKAAAHDLIHSHRDKLLGWPREQGAAFTVSYTAVNAPQWLPDDTWLGPDGRPGPRYLLTATVTAHP